MVNCTYCKQSSSSPPVEPTIGKKPPSKVWHCIAYTCPVCHRMMSVQIFPVSVKRRIRNQTPLKTSSIAPATENANAEIPAEQIPVINKPDGENPAGNSES